MEPAKNLATWEALRTLPEGVKAEIVRGVPVTPPAHDIVRPDLAGWRRELYARHGVVHYWLADPSAGTLETLRLDGQSKRWEP